MKALLRIVGLLVLAGLLYLGWARFFPSEPEKIRRTLVHLAETASVPAHPKTVGTILAFDRLNGFFMPDVEVIVDVPGEGVHTFSDRQELMQIIRAGWVNLRDMKIEFLDIVVRVNSEDSATAELTAKATQPGQKDFLFQEFKLQLKKKEGDWRIAHAESVKVLR